MTARRRIARYGWAWVLLGVVAVGALVVGARVPPTSGTSDERLFALAGQLKCLQCVGETVANSQAPIAIEVRADLQRQMRAGKTDDEILQYFVDRYGEHILLRPSGSGLTGVVWVVPVVAVAAALVGLAFAFLRWRNRRVDPGEISPEDRELVARALAAQRGGDDA